MLEKLKKSGNNLKATREATHYLFNLYIYLGVEKSEKWPAIHRVYSLIIKLNMYLLLPLSFTLTCYYEYSKLTTEQLLTSLQAFINVWGMPAKILTVSVSMKHLHDALKAMDTLDARCRRSDEYVKIQHCSMMGNRLAMLYGTLYCLYLSSTMISALSVGKPAYSLFIPFINWRNSTWEFVIHTTIEFFQLKYGCLHQAANDVYAVIYVYIIRTHVQILEERIRRLGTERKVSHEEHYKELVLCVKDHQDLLRLLNIISPVISVTMFIQFTVTAGILGITLINILVFADFSAQIASMIYLITVLVQTAPCCYHATSLIMDSNQLSTAIFHCEWIDKNKKFRKLMIFFMMRSQIPITLTAWKFFPITLDTILGIVKFSFSLYTFIKEMDFGKEFD